MVARHRLATEVLSLAGIHSSFGLAPVPLATWAVARAASTLVGHALFRDRRVQCDATGETYFVPGSRGPLAVIMAIFLAKYVCAVMNALNAAGNSTTLFIVALSAACGVLSGCFAARALNLISLARRA